MRRFTLTDEQIAYLAEHYHNTPNEELAKALGISIHTVRSRRNKHGWKKDKEFLWKLNHDCAVKNESWRRLNVEGAHERGVATRQKIYQADQARLRWGLEQLTKRHFRTEPREKIVQRNYLKRLGYIVDDVKLIAYYTPETHRARRLEKIKRGEKRGFMKPYYDFLPWEGNG